MKRLGRGRYAVGRFEIWLESRNMWRVWDQISNPPTPLEAFRTLHEAAQFCCNELSS